MDCLPGVEIPVLLQLHKWPPSQFELNLSEFREAFMSPTRELLLLLSYQSEALLLPLVKEDSICGDISENHNAGLQTQSSGAFRSETSTETCRFQRSNNYRFLCDVNSLAWGVCGDTYNHHEEASFRELLFVSSSRGVTVHAFCEPDKANTTTKFTVGDEFEQGRWVDWGPLSSSQSAQETFSFASEGSDTGQAVNTANGNGKNPQYLCEENGDAKFSRGSSPKTWLRSFFTKAETRDSNGKIWTKFPEKASFPCSAEVVSFSILDSGLPFVGFHSPGDSIRHDAGSQHQTHLHPESDAVANKCDGVSDNFGAGSYKCMRVFSSNSHHLIGFVLTLIECVPEDGANGSQRSEKIIILVARVNSWGIQWVSFVNLAGSLVDLVTEWSDFCFSDNLLVCLKASGLIHFYDSISGDFVAHIDILQVCGLSPHLGIQHDERVFEVPGSQSKQVNSYGKEFHQNGDFLGRINFRKLLSTSHTSLLAVVDEHGSTYVMCAGRYLPDKYYAYENFFHHLQNLGLGMLIGWEVGGSHIGHQRVHSTPIKNRNGSFLDYARKSVQSGELNGKNAQGELHMSGFSAVSNIAAHMSCGSEVHLHLIRKVFLPTERANKDDYVYFSSLGVTRLIKNKSEKNRSTRVVHFNLHKDSVVYDDTRLNFEEKVLHLQGSKEAPLGDAVGCTFQGCFYLVTEVGVSVVLPSMFVASDFLPVETLGSRQHSTNTGLEWEAKGILHMEKAAELFSPWKAEVLDRILLYEGPEEADRICLENGWGLKVSRLRRLQLAMDHLKFDEIEQSLEMLVGINLAEEGILRLLMAAVYLMFHKNGNDNDVSAAARLLTLATCFATKLIRKYGLLEHKKGAYLLHGLRQTPLLALPPITPDVVRSEMCDSERLHDMARLLEIIRNLQCRLTAKYKKPGQGLVDGEDTLNVRDAGLSQDESQLPMLTEDVLMPETRGQEIMFSDSSELALLPKDSREPGVQLDSEVANGVSILVTRSDNVRNSVIPLENPKEMIARWKLDNLDLKTVVKDALQSGRLPLAVLQLHLYRSRDSDSDNEPADTFSEVRNVGRAIAYDLFLKGETGLAVATLQRLGEDIETCLKQLLLGTARRSLRIQVADEMKRYGFLGPYEWQILEKILLIERLYPSTSFWRTFLSRQKALTSDPSAFNAPGQIKLILLPSPLPLYMNLTVECGEIDGVVLGSWTGIIENSPDSMIDEDAAHSGYWAAAAVWSCAWDQRTIDRIVLDQPFLMGVHTFWESQLEYYLCHNDWEEVSKLLDLIPTSVLREGNLQITLDGVQHAPAVGCSSGFPKYSNYISSIEEIDSVCMDVPGVKIFRFSVNVVSSMWLMSLLERELAKKLIFLKEYWEDTAEIVSLLSRSGFISSRSGSMALEDYSVGSLSDISDGGISRTCTMQAFHKLIIHHCVQYNLPNLMDLYLDHQNLALDNESISTLQEAAGGCEWGKWLLLSRIRGHEYDASFCNARSIASRNLTPKSKLNVLEMSEIIHTVDDIAEGGYEMAALATLMHSSDPIKKCLNRGSVKRHSSSSAQCTLENLRPGLQHYPTLWRTLVAASLGEDATSFFVPKETNALSDYLNWRDNIFFSSSHDTSLLQMLPCWFPKTLRRLIQLYIQGPFGWQSLSGLPVADSFSHRELDFYIHADEHTEINAVSWEATVQKHVQDELYDSSLKETGLGLEHHLHRGRALAAFNHILGIRVEGMKSNGLSGTSLGQANVQLDVQKLLAPLTQDEEALLLSVIPHAITHFEDSVLVTSCSFLWELCGLSASMLRVDVASLRRISSFYKLNDNNGKFNLSSPTDTKLLGVSHEGDMVASLARSLADEYLHKGTMFKGTANPLGIRQSSRAVMLVLQHLEKASLPQMMDGKTCGSWLLTGDGDGAELRSQQKAASQHWNLVSLFCQMHQLPLSTKYLAVLAKDNDWVGFLSEAQVGGYPFDTVVQVAAKEFSDQRLKIHVLTVLKGMHSKKMAGSPSASDTGESRSKSSWLDESAFIPVEFFRILADCEKEKNPGESLLKKAKEMSWSILAMVASCFTDVSPLSCLTVWLEITAARETSSIKVNDIATQIADNVGAAVEATNSLPAGSKAPTFHYNRQNPKRRRLMEHMALDALIVNADVGATSTAAEDERKQEAGEHIIVSIESDEAPASLSKMVALLCEQQLFIPLLRAFEMFLPSCSLLPFIRALQAFSQMRLAEASAHLGSFSARIKDEPSSSSLGRELREGQIGASWISSTAAKAANAVLSTCPSPYEKRCLLQLLAATDFGDGGFAAAYYGRLYWKINLAEPPLRKDDSLHLGNEALDDASLLTSLEKNGHWEHARNWARQLEASGGPWKSASHHVTETQAESMVAEWKEFLWDVPEERVALWGHCQTLFIRYSFPPLQAGLFFLKHAEAVEKDLPARELLELLLLALQWLSGMITFSYPVYPMNLLREIETRVWLLAVESEAQVKSDGDFSSAASSKDPLVGSTLNIIDKTASLITKMDNHINATRNKNVDKHDPRESNLGQNKNQALDVSTSIAVGTAKTKRRAKGFVPSRRPLIDTVDRSTDSDDSSTPLVLRNDLQLYDESSKLEMSLSKWEERVGPAELERAVLSLMEFGQITAAKQLQQKLSPGQTPSEFMLVDAALKLAAMSTPSSKVLRTMLDDELQSVIRSHNICTEEHPVDPFQVLESLTTVFTEGNGRGLCRRIVAVVKAANVLGLAFSEAFGKQPIELLQLLSLKAQESFDEASHLVQTHSMPPANIAQILAESFLKGLLAAHRGGYMDSQKEEGPAPLLWRFSDFLKWAELCPSESEIGHALMRLVITGQEIPHACEVELLILSHHFYKSSACLDGVDVLVALAATRVEAYVSEGDFPCLARLITGVGNFHALNFILGILIENGQLDLLLQKYSAAADTNAGTAEAVRGFRMAVLTSLKHFNPKDLDAFAMVYNHFDMKHETAALLESRAWQSSEQWFRRYDRDQNEDLLDSMRYFIEAAEVHSSIDAGNKTHKACAQASLVSLQIRMPDVKWLNLSETKARRLLVEQTRFQEALIVAEAYALNQPGEWALVLWNQMLKPELTEEFMAEFVAVLPLQPSMLTELARFYRAEVAARGDQSHFSVWLTGGGLPAEWAKYLGRSFRCLLKRTRDLRLRLQLATVATGFGDILDACSKDLDKVPDSAGPLVLRRGHGGAYLPLM